MPRNKNAALHLLLASMLTVVSSLSAIVLVIAGLGVVTGYLRML